MDASAKERHIPWNKGRLTGQKPLLKLREIGGSESGGNWSETPGTWPCLTWPSTASCVAAIWSGSGMPTGLPRTTCFPVGVAVRL